MKVAQVLAITLVLFLLLGVLSMVMAIAVPNFIQARNQAAISMGTPEAASLEITRTTSIAKVAMIAILCVMSAIPFALVGVLLYLLVKVLTSKDDRVTGDDARIMQEIHQGLSRLEKRVEALETLILDRAPGGQPTPRSREDALNTVFSNTPTGVE